MPEPTGCDDLKSAWESAQEAYDTAWWAEFAAELVWLGTGAATVTGGVAAGACWTAGEAATVGAATPACGWMTAGVVAGAAVTAGALIQAEQAETAREKAEAALEATEEAYCECLRGEAGGGPETPAPDTSDEDLSRDITFSEDEVETIVGDPLSEEGDEDDLDDEDAEDEECECEEGDPYDEMDDYGESEESDDAEAMSFYDPAAAP